MTATLDRPALSAPTWRERLQPLVHAGGGWGVTLLVTVIAGLLRFIRLDQPASTLSDKGVVEGPGNIFDEVYYACDAHNLVRYGVEHATQSGAAFCTPTAEPAFVVHPPLGKWLIGLGEKAFGFDTFGWRFAAALFGTLTVLLVVRIGRRMTGSVLLGGLAGLLLALDGLHFVQSRVAMLDVFLCFWVVATFGALVVDRDQVRARLAAAPDPAAARLGARPWRLLAGACAGAALATKWSALFPLAVLVVLAVLWEVGARRTAGLPEQQPWRAGLGVLLALLTVLKGPFPRAGDVLVALALLAAGLAWEATVRRAGQAEGVPSLTRFAVPALLAFALLPLAVYVLSWTGWFVTDGGWSRQWAHDRGSSLPLGLDAVRSWWHYHWEMYHFHSTLESTHPYQSHPLSWPFLGRPVSYYYPPGITTGRYGCAAASCSREVLAIGTPALWWAMIPACLGLAARWVSRRDWRASALLAMTAVSILAWIPSDLDDRTMFLFYALPSVPFLCLGIALLAGWAIGHTAGTRRAVASVATGLYTSLVLVNFAYLYPVLAAVTIPYSSWYHRMWFRSWI
ncbi:MAG TPA: phospholipid carrier-dependent glycosyltransferase [Mycobacteriales bacterium]|nr:phospholipid carrier-dependent glycosyltransferase [Mycobacteriales bacterium]